MWACNFAPTGWAFCQGQLLPISQNTALFSLLGTTFGGDGKSNFGLPNLQGTAPMHWGKAPSGTMYDWGETAGSPTVTLLDPQTPPHPHTLQASARNADLNIPNTTTSLARSSPGMVYKTPAGAATPQPLAPGVLSTVGSTLPHNNLMPYLTLNFTIALQGIYPPRS